MAASLSSQLESLASGLGSGASRGRLGLLVAVAALIALAAASWMWTTAPEYRVLYGHLEDRDGGAVLAALNQMNTPYRVADGGAILVPQNQVHDVRLRLASQGLPKGSIAGFELMENQKLGVTQFQEQINYQRGLEGELARSIQSLAAVRAARVHLAIPKPTVFMREAQKPTASVLLALHPGRKLERAQVAAIVHLVASSVPQLAAREISVVDDAGSLLSGAGGSEIGLDPAQLAYVQQVENNTNRRIVEILEPLVGQGNARARVTADVDFSSVESTAESYKPNQASAAAAVRSQVTSESGAATTAAASGIPGSASNQPAPPGPLPAAGAPAAGGPGNGRRDSTVNYEIDRQVQHVRTPVGTVRRLSAAVVVNHRRSVDADGKVTITPLPGEELEQIRALVRQAMGYSEPRGDTLNVTHAAFSVETPTALPDVPIWQQPQNIQLVKDVGRGLLIGAMALYILFGLIRPLFRGLAEARSAARAETAALPAPSDAPVAAAQDRLGLLRDTARQDPRLVANVIRNWVAKE